MRRDSRCTTLVVGKVRPQKTYPSRLRAGFSFMDDYFGYGPHQGQTGSASTLTFTRSRAAKPSRPIGFLAKWPKERRMAKMPMQPKGKGKTKKGKC